MNTIQVKSLLVECEVLAGQTGMLHYNIEKKRVSHTVNLLRRMAQNICNMQAKTQTHDEYAKHLEHLFIMCQIGPTEFIIDPQGGDNVHVFIHGTFDIDKLRQHLAVGVPEKTILADYGKRRET